MEIIVHLPPEVYGPLSLAERHLKTAKGMGYCRGRYERDRQRRHLQKVQKLVAKAARLLKELPID